jgi:transposase-like protein
MYIVKNMMVSQIAGQLGVSGGAVEKRLHEYDIRRVVPRNLKPLPAEELREMYLSEGKTIGDIATHLRCSKSAVRNHLISEGLLEPKVLKPVSAPRTKMPSEAVLFDLHVMQRKSDMAVAREYGVNNITVANWRRRYGIKRENKIIHALSVDELRRMYIDEKQTMEAISKRFGCGESTVRQNIIRYGLGLDSTEMAKRRLESNRASYTFRMECQGYRFLNMPNHPRAKGDGYIAEHRYVAECAIGRYLEMDEQAHHINLVKLDNRPENLAVLRKREHSLVHRYMERVAAYLTCSGAVRPEPLIFGREVFWGGRYVTSIDLLPAQKSVLVKDLFKAAVDAAGSNGNDKEKILVN